MALFPRIANRICCSETVFIWYSSPNIHAPYLSRCFTTDESQPSGSVRAAREIIACSIHPFFRNVGTANNTLFRCENNFCFFCSFLAELPGKSCRFIERALGSTPVYTYQQRPMLKDRWLSQILPNNLIRMHCTTITALFPTHHICEPRI